MLIAVCLVLAYFLCGVSTTLSELNAPMHKRPMGLMNPTLSKVALTTFMWPVVGVQDEEIRGRSFSQALALVVGIWLALAAVLWGSYIAVFAWTQNGILRLVLIPVLAWIGAITVRSLLALLISLPLRLVFGLLFGKAGRAGR
jgi:hypothetical protein